MTTRRQRRTDLEKLVSETMAKINAEHSPGLRQSIRDALDKGASPSAIILKWGSRSPLYHHHPSTALSVDWIVDEWQRERGHISQSESIETAMVQTGQEP